MKLLIALAVLVCSHAAKLDRTYLPPPGANTAGGSPGSLSAPHGSQSGRGPFEQTTSQGSSAPTFGRQNAPQGSVPPSHQGSVGSRFDNQSPSGSGIQRAQGSSPFGVQAPTNSHLGQNGNIENNFDQSTGPNNQDISGTQFGGQAYSQPERAQAAQDRAAEILRYENENDGEKFAYSFETSNGIIAEENGIATNGVQAQGAFSYTGDDGQLYSITYTADENGYQPHGDHLPTPPPIPEAILKSIEENAIAAAAGTQEGAYQEDFDQDNANDLQQYNQGSQDYNAPQQSGRPTQGASNAQSSFGTSNRPQASRPSQGSFIPELSGPSSQSNQYNGQSSSANQYNAPNPTNQYGSQTSSFNNNSPSVSNQYTASPSSSSQYNAPTSSSKQYSAPTSSSKQYSAPTSSTNQYSGPTSSSNQFSAQSSSSKQYSAPIPSSKQYNAQISSSNQYSAPTSSSNQFSAPSSSSNQYNVPSSSSNQYTVPTSSANQYNAPSSSSKQYTASNRYNAPVDQKDAGSHVLTQQRPTTQFDANNGYQYNRPGADSQSSQTTGFSSRVPQQNAQRFPAQKQLSRPGQVTGPSSTQQSSFASNNQGSQLNSPSTSQSAAFGRQQNQASSRPIAAQQPTFGRPSVGARPQYKAPNVQQTSRPGSQQQTGRLGVTGGYKQPSGFQMAENYSEIPFIAHKGDSTPRGFAPQKSEAAKTQQFGGPRQPPSFSPEEGYKY